MNLDGIVGLALGGFLLPVAGPGVLFSLNALAFLFAAVRLRGFTMSDPASVASGELFGSVRSDRTVRPVYSWDSSHFDARRLIWPLHCGRPRPAAGLGSGKTERGA